MSAYLCDAAHLAAIARYAATLSNEMDAERVFGMLLDENLKSISERYPDASKISDWFDEGESAFVWETIPEASHTATELRDLVGSYQYQSCEHAEWHASFAHDLCELLLLTLEPMVKAEEATEYAKKAERSAALAKLPSLNGKESAVQVRKLLKAHFPACKFSVRSDYNSVRISWTDGPTTRQVDALVHVFEAGHFDGMTDSYEYDRDSVIMINGQAFRPSCRYVFTNRSTSPKLARRAAQQIAAYFGVEAPAIVDRGEYWSIDNDARLPEASEYWSTLIHQAASDHTRFARD